MRKLYLVVFLLGLICAYGLGVSISSVGAQPPWTVRLAWTANTETDLAGYHLFHTSVQGVYDLQNPVDTPEASDVEAQTIVGDGFHCWVLTAFDFSNNESGISNEACITLPDDVPSYDLTPPGIPAGLMPIEVLPVL